MCCQHSRLVAPDIVGANNLGAHAVFGYQTFNA